MKSLGIPVHEISRIIIFDSENAFKEALAENKHLKHLVGLGSMYSKDFPGVFIAGFKKMDSGEHCS